MAKQAIVQEIQCRVCGKTIFCTRSEQQYMDHMHPECKPLAMDIARGMLRALIKGGNR